MTIYVNMHVLQFAVELKQCEELLGLIVANIDPAQVHTHVDVHARVHVHVYLDCGCIQLPVPYFV